MSGGEIATPVDEIDHAQYTKEEIAVIVSC